MSALTASLNTLPRVSIVIPCWNAQAYVGEAINSALSQTYSNVEVILIDDGSTDGSLEVIQSFGDRVRWSSGPNRGGCAARNTGIEMATGHFVQFLDADDTLHPEKLACQVAFALEHKSEITYCDHYVVTDKNPTPCLRELVDEEDDPVVLVLRHRTMQTPAPLHRRDALLAIGGFRVGLRAAQEFDLHLRLAVVGSRFRRLPQPLFTVRRISGSVSSHPGRTFACVLQFLPEAAAELARRGVLTPRRRREIAAYAARAGRSCLRDQLWREGRALLRFADQVDAEAADSAAYGAESRLLKRMAGPIVVEILANVARWGRARVRHGMRGLPKNKTER